MRNSVGKGPVRVRAALGLLPEISTVPSGRRRAEDWYMRGMPLDSGTWKNLGVQEGKEGGGGGWGVEEGRTVWGKW